MKVAKWARVFAPVLQIGAADLQRGLTVVSPDIGDYARTCVRLFNPWVDAVPAVGANAGD